MTSESDFYAEKEIVLEDQQKKFVFAVWNPPNVSSLSEFVLSLSAILTEKNHVRDSEFLCDLLLREIEGFQLHPVSLTNSLVVINPHLHQSSFALTEIERVLSDSTFGLLCLISFQQEIPLNSQYYQSTRHGLFSINRHDHGHLKPRHSALRWLQEATVPSDLSEQLSIFGFYPATTTLNALTFDFNG